MKNSIMYFVLKDADCHLLLWFNKFYEGIVEVQTSSNYNQFGSSVIPS